jgi:cob(I)alamin adenosyltransferase
MGNRLSKIYTRTGDKGTTGLSDGSRVAKDHIRVEVIGDVDELNSVIGVVVAREPDEQIRTLLMEIQHHLFNVGGELSLPGYNLINSEHVTWLETTLDRLNGKLEPLQDFILPGGTPAAAHCFLARAVCRRAERRLVTLKNNTTISEPLLQYINRLSDLLFVVARHINKQHGNPDILWQAPKKQSD